MITTGFKRRILLSGVIFAAVVVWFFALRGGEGRAFSGCEEDCQKCHSITDDEVNVILKKLKATDAKILKTQISPVKGLWEISIEIKGQRDVIYVDFSKKYMLKGAIVEVDAALNKTRERIDELNKDKRINPASISLKNALTVGSKTAQKKAIVFTDPD